MQHSVALLRAIARVGPASYSRERAWGSFPPNGLGSCGPSEEEVATEKTNTQGDNATSTQPITKCPERGPLKEDTKYQQEREEYLPAQQQPTPLLS